MQTKDQDAISNSPLRDHRVDVAEKKRLLMRSRLVAATMRVFAQRTTLPPVIDDVIREAKVSRGTFYNYFTSLEEILSIISQDLSNQMTADLLPVYDLLKDPIQRFSMGYRIFLTRAVVDQKWAAYVTRSDAWNKETLVDRYMLADLQLGKNAGQFDIEDAQVATVFLKGAIAHGILHLSQGIPDPIGYVEKTVRMGLSSLGCNREAQTQALAASAALLKAWLSGELAAARPDWAVRMGSQHSQLLLGGPVQPVLKRVKR